MLEQSRFGLMPRTDSENQIFSSIRRFIQRGIIAFVCCRPTVPGETPSSEHVTRELEPVNRPVTLFPVQNPVGLPNAHSVGSTPTTTVCVLLVLLGRCF